jgi:transposase-like protein
MTVACPKCGASNLDLVEVLEGERRRVKCEKCGFEWLRGEAKSTSTPVHRPRRDLAEAKEPAVFVDDDVAYLE